MSMTVLSRADALGYVDELRLTAARYDAMARDYHRKARDAGTPAMAAAYFRQERVMVRMAERTRDLAAFWDATMGEYL